MPPGIRRQHTAARRTLDEALLDQIGLDDVLDGVARFRQAGGDGLDADRAAAEIARDHRQVAPVERVEAERVDLQSDQGLIGDFSGDGVRARHRGEIAHAPKQPPGDARRAARAPGDLDRAFIVQRHAEDACATPHDEFQFLDGIEIEPHGDAETVAQRIGDEARAGGGRNQGEAGEIDLDRARRRPLADDQVELEILHRRIEDFLHGRIETVNLVDEEDVAVFQVRQQGGEVAGLGDHRAGG